MSFCVQHRLDDGVGDPCFMQFHKVIQLKVERRWIVFDLVDYQIVTEASSFQLVLSSGVVEGLNNKAKVTMRKSYGFRTFRTLELALYHSLGKLPEPDSTHDFF